MQILHIMCASLHHARPILAAAINSGFRESGVQSLRNLDDASALPILAVRTTGLAFSSVIGIVDDSQGQGKARGLVTETYLRLLVRLANDRFVANARRVERFKGELKRIINGEVDSREDELKRKEKMRARRLSVQNESHRNAEQMDGESLDNLEQEHVEGIVLVDGLELLL
jgi:tRNA wybutosine-synthesizing protein 3